MMSIRRWLYCRRHQERLSLYLDGQLSDREAARLERHLDECDECAGQLATLCSTVELLRSAPAPCMPRPVVIPQSVIAAQRQTRRLDRAFYALRTSAVAVSAALVLSLSWNAYALFGRSDSVAVEYALEEAAPAAMMASAPETEALVEAEQDVASEALAMAASGERVEETQVVEAEMVAEAAVASEGEADAGANAEVPEDEVMAMKAAPTEGESAVVALAVPEEVDVPPAEQEELAASEQAPLAREAPRDAQPGAALQKDGPAPAQEMPLGGGRVDPARVSRGGATWTTPRILATVFASALAVLLGLLVWIDRRRVRT